MKHHTCIDVALTKCSLVAPRTWDEGDVELAGIERAAEVVAEGIGGAFDQGGTWCDNDVLAFGAAEGELRIGIKD